MSQKIEDGKQRENLATEWWVVKRE